VVGSKTPYFMKHIQLQYNTVSSLNEFLVLQLQGLARPWRSHRRESLFLQIKHPNCEFWIGAWGQEKIIVSKDINNGLPQVWSTVKRSEEIKSWIVQNLEFSPV
jgi:hypothetical protein